MGPRIKRAAPHLAVFLLAVGVYGLGLLDFFEFKLADLRFRLLEREAASELVLVEIDTPSLQELDVWPWPREHHAALIDTLLGAGARQIAFDVDFSSRATPQGDRALAEALAVAGERVILATFTPKVRGQGPVADVTPLPALARHARLGSVNVVADEDGRVRRVSLTGPSGAPSLVGHLLEPWQRAPGSFLVDFGIRPEDIRRISYADVLAGRFDPGLFDGRSVLVGSTALELGDQMPVPVHGVLPGAMLLSLAYESVSQGRTLQPVAPWLIIAVTLALAFALGPWFERRSWRVGLATTTIALAAVFLASVLLQAKLPVQLDTTPWITVIAASFGLSLVRRIDRQALYLLAQYLVIRRNDIFMRHIVQNTFDGIMTFDRDGVVRSFNPAAERIFGCPAKEAVGSSLRKFVDLSETPNAEDGAAGLGRLRGGPFDLVGKRGAEQRLFPMQLAISEMALDGERCAIAVVRDITELKRREEALRVAKQEAEYANRAKTQFLANTSHELRTPLNAIIGFSEVMVSEVFGPLGAPQYGDYVNDIHKSGQHLLNLVNDLLDVSKIEAGEFTLQEKEVDIQAVLRTCLSMVSDRLHKARHRLRGELAQELPMVWADERAIKQILLNLVTNAIKFTPDGGRIVVGARVVEDGRLVVWVADTGIGIAKENIDRALSPFGQIEEGLSRKYEGTGLGLSLSKSLVELHGGTLTLESEPNAGTTVTITFPAARVRAAAQAMAPATA